MSTTIHILQSEVGYDLTTGQYIIAGIFSGTAKYWTGSAWSATFSAANLYTFGMGTQLTAATWTWVIPTAIDPGSTDDGRIYMRGWESLTTPTLADPPTWAVVDERLFATETTVLGLPVNVTVSTDSIQTTHLTMEENEDRSFTFILLDAAEDPISVLGDTVELHIGDLDYVDQYTFSGTVGGTDNNQVTCIVDGSTGTPAAGTWQYRLLDTTSVSCLSRGAFEVSKTLIAAS